MAVARLFRKNARMVMEVGVDPRTSNVLTRSYNFQLNHSTDPDQILNSIQALAGLSKHNLYAIEQVELSEISPF